MKATLESRRFRPWEGNPVPVRPERIVFRFGVLRLARSWVMGILVSILGMYFSVLFDLPTGATIVCTFGMVLAAMALVRPLIQRARPAFG